MEIPPSACDRPRVPSILEWSANGFNALSIGLAARNSVHTWWAGIVGCVLFAALFYDSRLYADAVLQVFFIATSVQGWRRWQGQRSRQVPPAPVTRVPATSLLGSLAAAGLVSALYGLALARYTNAYAPFIDSAVLALSVLGQLLLLQRRYEAWWVWLLVNVLSVGLFGSRGLWLTAALYSAFLLNACWALVTWRRLVEVRP